MEFGFLSPAPECGVFFDKIPPYVNNNFELATDYVNLKLIPKQVVHNMIAYDLQCKNGHTFEGWFEDLGAYNKQHKAGLVTCPMCDDTNVARIPSTFAIKGSPGSASNPMANAAPAAMINAIAQYVEKNFDNVGADFANEALKIHYGVNEPRNIRGVSTAQEEETLRKEGVAFAKLPVPITDPTPSGESDN